MNTPAKLPVNSENVRPQAQTGDPVVISIIVTFNPESSVFVDVMRAHARTGVSKVIIVDNASQNITEIEQAVGSAGMSAVELICLPGNVGIGAAQNIGVSRAIETGCSHVLFFDQDSLPPSEIVSTLLEEEAQLIAAGVRVGAIGPCFRDPRSGSYYPQARIFGPFLIKVWGSSEAGTPLEVSFIISSGSLVRIDVLKQVGPMNESFFIDMVDFEWCLRASARGFQIFVSSQAVLSHSVGDCRVHSLGREISIHSPERRYYMARNSILLARQPWVPAGYRIRELFSLLLRSMVFLFAVSFKWNYVKFISKGILHGLLGRGGKYLYIGNTIFALFGYGELFL